MPTVVRPIDGITRYLVAASVLGYHKCISAFVRLRPETKTEGAYNPTTWRDAVISALYACLGTHTCLWTVIVDPTSGYPKYALLQVDEMVLDETVNLIRREEDVGEDEAVRRRLELEINTPFDLISQKPLFRITIILPHESELRSSSRPLSVDLVISMHHVIGDGKSLISFCETLVTNLHQYTPPKGANAALTRPGGSESVPSLRDLAPGSGISLLFLLYVAFLELVKVVSFIGNRYFGMGYWRGNNVKYNIHDSGRCWLAHFELAEKDTRSLSAKCKSHETTFHGALVAACTLACARIASPTALYGQAPLTIRTNHTLCLRSICNVPNTVIGNFSSGAATDLVLHTPSARVREQQFWQMAADTIKSLRIGWAWWARRLLAVLDLIPDYKAYHKKAKTVENSITISNLGRIEFNDSTMAVHLPNSPASSNQPRWNVECAGGAQTAHPFWSPYTIIVATMREKMRIMVVYREKVVGDELEADRFVGNLKEVLQRIMENDGILI